MGMEYTVAPLPEQWTIDSFLCASRLLSRSPPCVGAQFMASFRRFFMSSRHTHSLFPRPKLSLYYIIYVYIWPHFPLPRASRSASLPQGGEKYSFCFHILADSFDVFLHLRKLNPFLTKHFRTLCTNHPEHGYLHFFNEFLVPKSLAPS